MNKEIIIFSEKPISKSIMKIFNEKASNGLAGKNAFYLGKVKKDNKHVQNNLKRLNYYKCRRYVIRYYNENDIKKLLELEPEIEIMGL